MIIGKHLIAGEWVGGDATFQSAPVSGETLAFPVGGAAEVDAAVRAAEEAFWSFGYSDRSTRARFLRRVADEIEARGAEITEVATQYKLRAMATARPMQREYMAIAAVAVYS